MFKQSTDYQLQISFQNFSVKKAVPLSQQKTEILHH